MTMIQKSMEYACLHFLQLDRYQNMLIQFYYMIEIMSYDAQRRFMVKVRQLVSYVKNMNV